MAKKFKIISPLVGPQGPKGDTGETGPMGPEGPKGPIGATGPEGPKGDTGATGPEGPQGPKGDTGDTGPRGPQGEKGDTGDTGPRGPQGEKGVDGTGVTILGSYASESELNSAHPTGDAGDSYLVNGYLYVWSSTSSTWENVGNIQGPKGDKGDKGDTGATGPEGPKGDKGDKGDTGATGPEGPKGDKGDKGDAFTYSDFTEAQLSALKGDKGDTGATGPEGPKGDKGDKGDTGATGPEGPKGDTGATGAVGPEGPQGPEGPKGDKGDTGATGPEGPKGDKGDKGDTGATGTPGERGTGILKITTAPSAYTTATGGFTPAYRIDLATVKTQSKVSKVLVGDTIAYNYYQYPVGYVDDSYVYVGARTSVRGATGSTGPQGPQVHLIVTEAEFDAMTQSELQAAYNEGKRLIIVENEYTNLVQSAISENGGVYYGCGYRNGVRLNSSGEIQNSRQSCITGFIPCIPGAQLEVYGSKGPLGTHGNYVAAYDANFAVIAVHYMEYMSDISAVADEKNIYTYSCKLTSSDFTNAAYIRISLNPCEGRDIIVRIGGQTV